MNSSSDIAVGARGFFNVVEGVVNHEILGLHYDLGFLVFGALLVVGGWLLTRPDERDPVGPS